MRTFRDLERGIAHGLILLQAIKFGQFRLKLHETQPDAPLSPIFLNLRDKTNPKPGPLTVDVYRMAATCMLRTMSEERMRYDFICGLPRAGEPFAAAIAECLSGKDKNLFHLEKIDAAQRRVVASAHSPSLAGRTVVIIDDLITEAHTKVEGIEAIRSLGGHVENLIVLVDRCQGGARLLEEKTGVKTHAVFTLPDLLDFYLSIQAIDPKTRGDVLEYLTQNQAT